MQDLHVSGRGVSSLPGSSHSFPEGTMCDEHQDRVAVKRIQGETDSFGCEYHLMCQECADEHRKHKEELGGADHIGNCSCGNHQVPVFAMRDYDEGSAGPIYYKCQACKTEWRKREAEEAERYYAERGDVDDFDDWGDSGSDSDDYIDYGPADEEPQHAGPPKPPVVTYKRRRKVEAGVRGL